MALPGVTVAVADGNLNLQAGSSSQIPLFLGCSLGGTSNTLYSFGDQSTMTTTLVGGSLLEIAGYNQRVAGGQTFVMPLPPTTRGGASSVTKVGTGSDTLTVSLAPWAAIVITCTTAGALATAKFTFKIGTGATSQPVTSAAGWSSTGYLIPGTYTNVVFPAHSYAALETYTYATSGSYTYAANGSGGSDATLVQTSSPVDDYSVTCTITTAGALATSQFTYSLDSTSGNTSASILTTASTGLYAIPNTGVVLTWSGTAVAGNVFTFSCAGPTFTAGDMATAMTALQTTYLASATYSMISLVGTLASAAAWSTQVASLQTQATTFFGLGIYLRMFSGCPTVGTILPNAGSVTVDSADTDAVVIAARVAMSASYVCPCAGDFLLSSPVTGLVLRRNALWAAAVRAASVEASQDIGAVLKGAVASASNGLYRDENATPGFFAAGITCLRTFTSGGGIYITRGLMATVSTSDYYPLTNARVVDRGCAIARINTQPYVLAKLATVTRNGNVGTIAEKPAQKIEARVNGALATGLVDVSPQDAVATSVTVNRTNNLLATGNLILAVSIQPFGYSVYITVNIGMQTSV